MSVAKLVEQDSEYVNGLRYAGQDADDSEDLGALDRGDMLPDEAPEAPAPAAPAPPLKRRRMNLRTQNRPPSLPPRSRSRSRT
jgi:hypothetical protein